MKKDENNTINEKIEDDVVGNDDIIEYILKKPVNFEGQKIDKLTFDFSNFTGKTMINIEDEARAILGRKKAAQRMSVPVLNPTYQACFAAKACSKTSDFILGLGASDFNNIAMIVQDFLLED